MPERGAINGIYWVAGEFTIITPLEAAKRLAAHIEHCPEVVDMHPAKRLARSGIQKETP